MINSVYSDGFLVQNVKPRPHKDAIIVMLREQNILPSACCGRYNTTIFALMTHDFFLIAPLS